MAERLLNAQFGNDLVDHKTYVIAGDGCLMEGISHEAISLAGHLKLNKLMVLFDDNSISIDGPTSLSVSDDQLARFEASGWRAERIDGHDAAAIAAALTRAQSSDKPSLIACRTVIGYGAPKKAGTAATHGSPLGAEEVAGAREKLGWSHAPFVVPNEILSAWRAVGERGAGARAAWKKRLAAHNDRAEFERRIEGDLPAAVRCRRRRAEAGRHRPKRRRSPRGNPRRRCWTRWRRSCRNWSAARPISRARTTPRPRT